MSLNYRSLNQITLVGRIGQDAALKQTQSGASFATFSVATQTLLNPKAEKYTLTHFPAFKG